MDSSFYQLPVMRALMIAPGPFFVDRGFGVSVYEQARALQRRHIEVEVVCYPAGRDVPGVKTHRAWPVPGYDATRIGPSPARLPLWIALLAKALSVARRTKPDVLHGHLHEGALIASIVSRLTGVPWLFDFQGSLSLEMAEKGALREGTWPFRTAAALEGWTDRRAPRILVRSAAMQRDLERRFHVRPERIARIMDGADPERFSPRPHDEALARRLGLPAGRTMLGYLGLLSEQQGIERLLRATALLLGERDDLHVLVMGYPVEGAMTLARELGVLGNVTFTGRVDYEATPDYLALCDLALAPKVSRTEGNGKVYNYAGMALPVVAIDSEVNREVLAEDAYYARDERPESFADAIRSALPDRESWAERGRRLRARLEAEFTWDAVAARIEEAYRVVAPEAFREQVEGHRARS